MVKIASVSMNARKISKAPLGAPKVIKVLGLLAICAVIVHHFSNNDIETSKKLNLRGEYVRGKEVIHKVKYDNSDNGNFVAEDLTAYNSQTDDDKMKIDDSERNDDEKTIDEGDDDIVDGDDYGDGDDNEMKIDE
eukprot:CAMPEP_0184857114 /NCGR_PEP_ID=MMETSP0580-20130426/2285_1 /TAXON_ID=1118495 /ORGANISM="Dactyliosolen fragilissimus" /LENGTH=134 /DNA_ID=CAMNT_0027352525 /DNA_START=144 /DNA_END=545 /DNA_ORIENTATION=-